MGTFKRTFLHGFVFFGISFFVYYTIHNRNKLKFKRKPKEEIKRKSISVIEKRKFQKGK